MDTLSSCYFCGTAIDEPLAEYPVVPEPFRADDATTATLCPACHQKLETILDTVVEAIDMQGGGQSDDVTTATDAGDDHEPAPPDGSESGGDTIPAESASDTHEGTDADEGGADDGLVDLGDSEQTPAASAPGEQTGEPAADDPIRSAMEPDVPEEFDAVSTRETAADQPEEPDGTGAERPDTEPGDADDPAETVDEQTDTVEDLAGNVDPEELVGDDGDDGDGEEDGLQSAMEPDVPAEFQSGGDRTASEGTESDAGESPSGPATDESPDESDTGGLSDEPAVPADEPGGGAGVDTDETTTDSDGAASDDADAADAGATDGTESRAAGTTDEEATGSETTISALEYNKVMRLLQNREFPVDRAEIETVAANAYDLSRAECGAVIDLAIDRGLVDEAGGQLHRPE